MEDKWFLDSVQIQDGFLDGVDLQLPEGLTCIIGPRGSGKSTLSEALRIGMAGLENPSKERLELFKHNLSKATVSIRARIAGDGRTFCVRREGRQQAILRTVDGNVLSAVDLDRGTFLPLDAYSSMQIEEIARETFGPKRRALLDDLRSSKHFALRAQLAEAKRELDANADKIRAEDKQITDLTEQIEGLSEARAWLAALPEPKESEDTATLKKAASQNQLSQTESSVLKNIDSILDSIHRDLQQLSAKYDSHLTRSITEERSANYILFQPLTTALNGLRTAISEGSNGLVAKVESTHKTLEMVQSQLDEVHLKQAAVYDNLRERNREASEGVKMHAEAVAKVQRLDALEKQRGEVIRQRNWLLEARKKLRGDYLILHDGISELRDEVAHELANEVGENVRIIVRRSADSSDYQQLIFSSLQGASLQRHDSIVEAITRILPHELAQLIQERNVTELANTCRLAPERARKILDALRYNVEPLHLETVTLDDVIAIELNVGLPGEHNYKEASRLSRGQQCTALLPLLLARRQTPLVIDQPEDNLDNHFIFQTVVNSVRQLKGHRQMIFITHNANIPVLAEADLIVVMASDGEKGYIEKIGTLTECRQEIIDLLEGGREAFRRRQVRYGLE